MATAFDTFDQYADTAYPGQLADRGHADVVSRIATDSDIGYGLAVREIDQRSAALPTGSEVSHGVTLRETVRDNPAGDNPTPIYPEGETMSVLRVGRVYVETADGAAVDDPAYVVPSTGVLTNSADQQAPTGDADSGNTGDGTIGTISGDADTITGDYVATIIEPATDGGIFMVQDPEGRDIGSGTVGTEFSDGGITFTISDGATDFVAGDRFIISVTQNNVAFPAVWKSAASAGDIALLQING